MAAHIPDEKVSFYLTEKILLEQENAAGYHPGPVAPSTADGTL